MTGIKRKIKKERKKEKNIVMVTKKKKGVFFELKKNRALYGMTLPALIYLLLFSYIPLYGIQVAFRNYNFVDGITKSPWVGLKNFEFFFKSKFFLSTTFNTLFLNFMIIGFGLVAQVGVAILLNEIVNKKAKKIFQTAMFFPYFISWIVVDAFVKGLLSEKFGLINNIIRGFGGEGVAWYNNAAIWPFLLVAIAIWKSLGYNAVIYLAAIAGIDQEIYEAAKIDGANKFQEIFKITLPLLKPTIVMLLLMSIGNMFRGDFQMVYSIIGDNSMLLPTTEIIDTYVFRAMRLNSQYGTAAAVGLYQSIMGFVLVMISNYLVRRNDKDLAIF